MIPIPTNKEKKKKETRKRLCYGPALSWYEYLLGEAQNGV